METGRIELILNVISSFTSIPIEASLVRALRETGIADKLRFVQYAQMSEYMLEESFSNSAQVLGTIVLLRVEDWLRESLSSTPDYDFASSQDGIRQQLCVRIDEFLSQLSSLSQRGKPVWVVVCPSSGWICQRYKINVLCQAYTNLLTVRVQNVPKVMSLTWPSHLFENDPGDYGADRLGQIPFTQDAFDMLGASLSRQVEEKLRSGNLNASSASAPTSSGNVELAEYLKGLALRVYLRPVDRHGRVHVDRILRSAASFSLQGENRDISEGEIDSLLDLESCMLISVSDRLSDYGPSGVVAFSVAEDAIKIKSMALSCKVLGKQVEYAVLSALTQLAIDRNVANLIFEYKPGVRNQSMLAFLESVTNEETNTRHVLPLAVADRRIRAAAVNFGAWAVSVEHNHIEASLQ